MNARIVLVIPLLLLLMATCASAQDSAQVICKGASVPDGFVVSGEAVSDSCRGGTGWIIRRVRRPQNNLDRFPAAASNALAEAEPNEVIAPGQCDAFQQEIARTYNFNPAGMSHSQVEAQSKKLDDFWGRVRESRTTLLPCLRKALKEERSDSFFNIDGSMLLVDVDPSRASKALQVRKFVNANLDGTDLEYFVKYLNMTPMEALISATRWGGQIMMRKDLGEIREGWLADLLLVDGDPLANISMLQDKSKLLAIMKDGEFTKSPEIRSTRSRFVA
jgi:hypothetical protein